MKVILCLPARRLIVEQKPVDQMILEAVLEVKKLPSTREASLVVTKLEEALLWLREDEARKRKAAQESGVGIR